MGTKTTEEKKKDAMKLCDVYANFQKTSLPLYFFNLISDKV